MLSHLRLHLNDFVDTFWGKFTPRDPVIDLPTWTSSNPLGAVINIDIPGDDGVVVCSEYASDHWNFSTIRVPDVNADFTIGEGMHPVSGTRQFGFYHDPANQNVVFFTRGADRTSNIKVAELIAFYGTEKLWESLHNKLHAFIINHGGEAIKSLPHSKRYDWSQ
jgi:hypothetical protein